MKDNFSAQASGYAAYRPHYPEAMIAYIVSFVKDRQAALDVATGNGQVAVALSPWFDTVYATDISARQLENARQAHNVHYSAGSAESTGFDNQSFDLLTVAQAIHWFNFEQFYNEARRILKPGGVLAVMGYGLFTTNPETDAILLYLYKDILGSYWDAERRYVDERYTTIPFEPAEIETKHFYNNFTWTFEQLTGYLATWSAVQHYIKKNGTDPVDLIREKLHYVWEISDKQVTFPLLLRMGRFV